MASLTLAERSIGLPTTPNWRVLAYKVPPESAEVIAAAKTAGALRWIIISVTGASLRIARGRRLADNSILVIRGEKGSSEEKRHGEDCGGAHESFIAVPALVSGKV